MRKTLIGVTDQELQFKLSDLAMAMYQENDLLVWQDKKTGLFSLSVGWDIRKWVLFDVTVQQLDDHLCGLCPFWEGGVEVEECLQ